MTSDHATNVKRVVVLGAGFAGLELTIRLSEEFGTDLEITLIDRGDAFVFGFSKLGSPSGRSARRPLAPQPGGL